MGMAVYEDIAFLHRRKIVLIENVSVGGIKSLSLHRKKGIICQNGEFQNHLIYLRITVSPNSINLVL